MWQHAQQAQQLRLTLSGHYVAGFVRMICYADCKILFQVSILLLQVECLCGY